MRPVLFKLMFRCGGGGLTVVVIAIVGVPLLYSVKMLLNVPNGCLQISFFTKRLPRIWLLCRTNWNFNDCVNFCDFVADIFHR